MDDKTQNAGEGSSQQQNDNLLVREDADSGFDGQQRGGLVNPASDSNFGGLQSGAATGVQMEAAASDAAIGGDLDAAAGETAPFMAEENEILKTREVKYNWEGRDLRVVAFQKNENDEAIIVLQNPPGQGGQSFAPLTESARVYLLARIHV